MEFNPEYTPGGAAGDALRQFENMEANMRHKIRVPWMYDYFDYRFSDYYTWFVDWMHSVRDMNLPQNIIDRAKSCIEDARKNKKGELLREFWKTVTGK